MSLKIHENRAWAGSLLALAAVTIWSVYPMLWSALTLRGVYPSEVLAHRIAWAGATGGIALAATKREHEPMPSRTVWCWCLASGALINGNWLISIWAVGSGHVVDASLGFFMAPLVSAVLGVLVFRDRLVPLQYLALALVASGVAYTIYRTGRTPWIGLALAGSSAGYSAIRKWVQVDALRGLCIETAIFGPLSVFYLVRLEAARHGHFGTSVTSSLLLVLAGVLTAGALLSYVGAARRLQLSTLGLMQYIHPSVQFVLGVTIFREVVEFHHSIMLVCIVGALVLYSSSGMAKGILGKKEGELHGSRAA